MGCSYDLQSVICPFRTCLFLAVIFLSFCLSFHAILFFGVVVSTVEPTEILDNFFYQSFTFS